MKIEMRDVDSIRPYEKNPRQNAEAVDAVAKSIEQFGWRQPIVIDTSGVIVIGHTRLLAAKKLGMKTVPVHVAEGLSDAQIKALRIADNATGDIATWDYDLLPLELKDLQAADFDLSMLGFDEAELAKLLAPEGTDGLTDPDAVPEPPAEPVTQPGDLWLLGAYTKCPHCGEVNEL
ncbi:MAG: ParB-like nuclease domain protein [Planctomycetes bacterium ADurb.Bin126]|nr:MAG: ParB-like nuclease domain protein [Planctomycetes bacterium ADurb.Bin126]